jgi:hypothetical protein
MSKRATQSNLVIPGLKNHSSEIYSCSIIPYLAAINTGKSVLEGIFYSRFLAQDTLKQSSLGNFLLINKYDMPFTIMKFCPDDLELNFCEGDFSHCILFTRRSDVLRSIKNYWVVDIYTKHTTSQRETYNVNISSFVILLPTVPCSCWLYFESNSI